MRFPAPLTAARLIRRYKRFLADVELPDGTAITVHCANPGAMTGLMAPGSTVWLSRSDKAARKLPWSWELIEADGGLVGINTGLPNALVAEALATGAITELAGYARVTREVRYGAGSRVDFVLTAPDRPMAYVEVKNAHLSRQPGLAEFPDSVTKRGARHLDELAAMAKAGHRAVLFILVQRTDCDRFALARDLDPAYGLAFDRAVAAGVEAIAYRCRIARDETAVADRIPIVG